MHRIIQAQPLDNYRIDLTFADGTRGVVDLSYLAGRGVFALWNDPAQFNKVQIGEAGELIWSEQIDLCPDALYLKVARKEPADLFPTLRSELAHA